eukprot:scaffold21101_cov56-Attheya_sp.AAC.2
MQDSVRSSFMEFLSPERRPAVAVTLAAAKTKLAKKASFWQDKMVLQALKTTGVRVATAQARRGGARRNMAGHAPAPEWTGIDKTVRGYFPQDYQCT